MWIIQIMWRYFGGMRRQLDTCKLLTLSTGQKGRQKQLKRVGNQSSWIFNISKMAYCHTRHWFVQVSPRIVEDGIDPFQKWRHVTWFREVEDKHQNKSYVSEDQVEGNLEVFAQWWTFVRCSAAQIVPTERRTMDIIVFPRRFWVRPGRTSALWDNRPFSIY